MLRMQVAPLQNTTTDPLGCHYLTIVRTYLTTWKLGSQCEICQWCYFRPDTIFTDAPAAADEELLQEEAGSLAAEVARLRAVRAALAAATSEAEAALAAVPFGPLCVRTPAAL